MSDVSQLRYESDASSQNDEVIFNLALLVREQLDPQLVLKKCLLSVAFLLSIPLLTFFSYTHALMSFVKKNTKRFQGESFMKDYGVMGGGQVGLGEPHLGLFVQFQGTL